MTKNTRRVLALFQPENGDFSRQFAELRQKKKAHGINPWAVKTSD